MIHRGPRPRCCQPPVGEPENRKDCEFAHRHNNLTQGDQHAQGIKQVLQKVALTNSCHCFVSERSGRYGVRMDDNNECQGLPSHSALKTALAAATATETSGLNNQMWAAIVNRDGVVCAVAFSGVNRGAQWPASRAIAAQKANTANALSLDASSYSGGSGQSSGLALSTANLYSANQPGGIFYGLQASNPVSTEVAYQEPSSDYGTAKDPMVGQKRSEEHTSE